MPILDHADVGIGHVQEECQFLLRHPCPLAEGAEPRSHPIALSLGIDRTHYSNP